MSGPIDPGVVELAGRVLDLARGGHADLLAECLDAGVPANLTNDILPSARCSPPRSSTSRR